MAFRRENKPSMEQVSAFLLDAVEKVKENPDGFEELRRTFKKIVPLTLRSVVAAYILDQATGAIFRFNNLKNRGEFQLRNDFRNDFNHDEFRLRRRYGDDENISEFNGERHERYQHIEIAPDFAATVFVGVGKNRRVYPKDIVGLFISVAGIEKERIGDIKVYANYSFVQLFKEDADKAISALNGYDYRGRRLSVSYSRQRPLSENDSSRTEGEGEFKKRDISNENSHILDSSAVAENETRSQQAAFAAAQNDISN